MRRLTAVAIGGTLLLAACGPGSGGDAAEDRLAVVASVAPLAEVAGRVGGDRVVVESLTPPGAEPHDVEISSAQMDAVLDADVVLYVGGGFQAAVEEAVAGSGAEVVDVLEAADPRSDPDGGVDPHVWLDPLRMTRIVEHVAGAFTRADPDGAQGYRARAEAYTDEVAELHEAFTGALETCDRRLLVVSHAAFGYLAGRYDLEQEAISGLSPEGEPDPRRLGELAELAEERDVTTVFTETLVSPRAAETLAREADLSVATLDPIESLEADADYLSVMRDNLDALTRGLGCR